jgi:flagellar motor switch protein FliM
MSDTQQVLSSDEVDALLKATQEKDYDLSKSLSTSARESGLHNVQALDNIAELTKVECEKILSSFFRRKIIIKAKEFNLSQLSNCLKNNSEKKVFSIVRLMPRDHYGMFAVDFGLLHHTINSLYGGHIDPAEPVMEHPGKVGLVIAEKISQLCLAGFVHACQEHGEVTSEIIKTSTLPNLSSNLVMDDQVYSLDMTICFDGVEAGLSIMIAENFMNELVPVREGDIKHREKDFWRTAIKTQVVDSVVSISVSLTDVNMKMQDFMTLKTGDLIPIGDPTLVYVCLNNLKLFRAKAGQANSKRVAKILSQI